MNERSFDGLINPCVFFVSVIQEGRALIDALRLERVGDETVELYSHPTLPLHLVVMGIGRDAAETAVSYASTRWETGPITWVNFGIAGHRDHALGTFHQVVAVSVDGEGDNEIVLTPVLSALSHAHLRTFTHFVEARPPAYLCDMEAYWIAREQAKLCPDVSLYVFKVVSDNETDNLLLSDVGKTQLAAHLEHHAQDVLERLHDTLITR